MAYQPPHLRKKSESKSSTRPFQELDQDCRSIKEIQQHYGKKDLDDDHRGPPQHSTLNDSAEQQGSLTHVLLFHGANPRWEADKIIFVKSNLDILPEYHSSKAKMFSDRVTAKTEKKELESEQVRANDDVAANEEAPAIQGELPKPPKEEPTSCDVSKLSATDKPPIDIKPSEPKPIAIFEQRARTKRDGGFKFTAYYVIDSIALLAPRSKELARMLEQKWSHEDRRGNMHFSRRSQGAWEESLRHEWAVIKFRKMEGESLPKAPVIEKLQERAWEPKSGGTPKKSVNEMLAEMRFGKSSGDGAKSS